MISTILGTLLVVLGAASYVVALAVFVREKLVTKEVETAVAAVDVDAGSIEGMLKAIAEVLDKASNALEQFAKLSERIQWALLGLLSIGIGAYLLSSASF